MVIVSVSCLVASMTEVEEGGQERKTAYMDHHHRHDI
jgi:hypothetical protein